MSAFRKIVPGKPPKRHHGEPKKHHHCEPPRKKGHGKRHPRPIGR